MYKGYFKGPEPPQMTKKLMTMRKCNNTLKIALLCFLSLSSYTTF